MPDGSAAATSRRPPRAALGLGRTSWAHQERHAGRGDEEPMLEDSDDPVTSDTAAGFLRRRQSAFLAPMRSRIISWM